MWIIIQKHGNFGQQKEKKICNLISTNLLFINHYSGRKLICVLFKFGYSLPFEPHLSEARFFEPSHNDPEIHLHSCMGLTPWR
jgi:hypothetical protein